MPVEFPLFGGDGDPRSTLVKFLTVVHDFLDELVGTNRDPSDRPLFFEQLLSPMRSAWSELNDDGHFQRAREGILGLTEAQWRAHGLYGRQLSFKLAVIRFFYDQYRSVGKGILKWLIDIIDDLLKSILDAIHVGGAIAEMKDFIKDSIDDADSIKQ